MAEAWSVFLQHMASQCKAVVTKKNLPSPYSVPGSMDSLGNKTEAIHALTELTSVEGSYTSAPRH